VRQLVRAIVVALLTFSVSGVTSLAFAEPCQNVEQAGPEDGSCPPTCVTCGCCTQAAEPTLLIHAHAQDAPVDDIAAVLTRLVETDPQRVLHVPKARLA
jgi:hypothetical protein